TMYFDTLGHPGRIGAAHPPNQIAELGPNPRPTVSGPTLPCPVASESCRCQPTTVSGPTTYSACRQLPHGLRAEPKIFGPSPSAVAAARAPPTQRVAAAAPGSLAPTRGACEQSLSMSQRG